MRYLVKAKVKEGRRDALMEAIHDGTLGKGSVAEDGYLRNMQDARQLDDNSICWVEVCYCPTPLREERPYWEAYFDLVKIKNAHSSTQCKDLNGIEHYACDHCDCSARLEAKMESWGRNFL
jgi:hypothetical protein